MRNLVRILFKTTIRRAYATLKKIIDVISKSEIKDDEYLNSMKERLGNDIDEYSEAINRDRSYSLLIPVDKRRDNLIRIMFMEVNAKTLYSDETIAEAAITVKEVIDRYGLGIIDKSYADETADIDAMLTNLEESTVKDALTKLGNIADTVNELKEIANEWKSIVYKQQNNKGELLTKPSATKVKNRMVELVNNELVIYLASMTNYKPDIYKPINDTIQSIIKENNSLFRNNPEAE